MTFLPYPSIILAMDRFYRVKSKESEIEKMFEKEFERALREGSEHKREDSKHKREDSKHKREDSKHKREDSKHKREDSKHKRKGSDYKLPKLPKKSDPLPRPTPRSRKPQTPSRPAPQIPPLPVKPIPQIPQLPTKPAPQPPSPWRPNAPLPTKPHQHRRSSKRVEKKTFSQGGEFGFTISSLPMISMQSSTEIEVASKKPPKEPPKERKLRILFTTFWDYPHVGGLSNYISSLQKELRERGHRVDVIAPNHFPDVKTNGLRDKIEADLQHFFLKRYKESNEKIISNLRGMLCYHYYLLREVDLQKYDVIHAQDIFTANIVGRCIHRAPKPLFFTPHGHFTSSRLKFGKFTSGSVEEAYYLQIERSAVESAKKMVILCESFRAPLNALGADDEKMKTVYTGIDFTVKRKIPPANASINGVEATKPLILTCVSRLAPRKGHKFLFEALHQIRHATGPLEVRIVGDGSTRAELEKQVKELKLTNVRFLGNSDQVAELLAQSDIFVHPTINDNLPIAIIEAMFGQQAIITTNCGGIPELIQHEQRGLIAEAGNSSDLAEKLLRVLEDRDLRERLAQQAKQFAETHLTAHNMTSQIEEMYQSVV